CRKFILLSYTDMTVVLFASDGHCDRGYLLYKDFCYHFETEQVKNWQDAEAYCVEQQGHLVSFHSEEELSFLTGDSKWIGLRHNPIEGGEERPWYSWSDGTPLSHTNWGHGEPNNHEDREECVEMVSSSNGTFSWWNDLNCDAKPYICKISSGITDLSGACTLSFANSQLHQHVSNRCY
uniref:C-type lectin domain-containing protein n=1 Tax=Poecilia reticulata TaxID=8081 RepID=A0A3P9N6N2_POERE